MDQRELASSTGQLLELARMVEREPALLGLSPHLMVVARKP